MTCVGLYFSKSALVASASLWTAANAKHFMSDSDVRAEIGRMGSPQVTLTRLCENPGLAVTTSVARIGGFGLEDGPDGVADEPVATSNENDVWHRRC